MFNTTPSIPVVDEQPANESYHTFWDAIPVEAAPPVAPGEAPPTARVSAPPVEDAYAAFLTQSEEGSLFTLHVEQTDVG